MPGLSRRSIVSIAAAVSLLMLAVPAVTAARESRPPGPVRTATASILLGAGDVGMARATCPRGTRFVSGGFSSSYSPMGAITVFEARRLGKRSWGVRGANGDTSERELVALAYCRRGAPLLKPVSKTVSLSADSSPPVETASVGAVCPKGKRAISGGFKGVFGPGGAFATITFGFWRPRARTWRLDVLPYAVAPQQVSYTGYAYCGRQRLRPHSATATIDPGGIDGPVTPKCGKLALSGGWRTEPTDLAGAQIVVVANRLFATNLWNADGRNFGSAAGDITAIAYCGR